MRRTNIGQNIVYLAVAMASLAGCTKLIAIDPPVTQLTDATVFSDTTTATAALISNYAIFNTSVEGQFNKPLGVYADDAAYTSTTGTDGLELNTGKLSVNNNTVAGCWTALYSAVYRSNNIIGHLQQSGSLPAANALQLTSEAKFLRAYAYFLLVNVYGHVPLLLSTDVNANAHAGQADSLAVYAQIIADLKDAQNALPVAYIGTGKTRANKWVATALLAKVNLFQNDYAGAFTQSSAVINSGLYTPLPPLSTVFIAGSKETILSIPSIFLTGASGFIYDGTSFIPTAGQVPVYAVSTPLLNAFEPGDQRKDNWTRSTVVGGITYNYFYKYHNSSVSNNLAAPENLMILRVAEQYLIRGEAQANGAGAGISGAISDLNVVRTRAGLPNYNGLSEKEAVLQAIRHERQVEYFMENANRFFDLKRTKTIDAVLSAYKPAWVSTASVWPIPQNERTYDVNLTQNKGY